MKSLSFLLTVFLALLVCELIAVIHWLRYFSPSKDAPAIQDSADAFLHSIESYPVVQNVRRLSLKTFNFTSANYVVLSAHRRNASAFLVVGEVDVRSVLPQFFCTWSKNSQSEVYSVPAQLLMGIKYNGKPFSTCVAHCDFDQVIGEDDGGGMLYLGNDFQEKLYLIHTETPNTFSNMFQPPVYNITFCSPPLHGKIQMKILKEWFLYHSEVINVEHFYLHDFGGLNSGIIRKLNSLLPPNAFTITRLTNYRSYFAWYFHQQTNNNDCLYHNRFSSKWTLFTDLDEFIYVPPPDTPLLSQLEHESFSNVSWYSMGSINWSTRMCAPPKRNPNSENGSGKGNKRYWIVERMNWRAPGPTCRNQGKRITYPTDFCPRARGHRKVVVKPSLVTFVDIHEVIIPKVGGHVWNASLHSPFPKIYHYQGILKRMVCKKIVKIERLPPASRRTFNGFYRDVTMRNLFQKYWP